jgi:hypothetical protein
MQARLLNIEFSRLMAMNNMIDETKSEMYQVCGREHSICFKGAAHRGESREWKVSKQKWNLC